MLFFFFDRQEQSFSNGFMNYMAYSVYLKTSYNSHLITQRTGKLTKFSNTLLELNFVPSFTCEGLSYFVRPISWKPLNRFNCPLAHVKEDINIGAL